MRCARFLQRCRETPCGARKNECESQPEKFRKRWKIFLRGD
jgi:hypothetical protein